MPDRTNYFLKITPLEGGGAVIQILKDKPLPQGHINSEAMWIAGVLTDDGCIYYMPFHASHILRLDPNNSDSLSLVGENLGYADYGVAVLSNDGFIYGIPSGGLNLIKYNPRTNSTDIIEEALRDNHFYLGGVTAADGNIYSLNEYGQVLKICTCNNQCSLIGDRINYKDGLGWGLPVLGDDKCIYFPPYVHNRSLHFNPISQDISLIGELYEGDDNVWADGILASDGYIYCAPFNSNNILLIDTRHFNKQVIEFVQKMGGH